MLTSNQRQESLIEALLTLARSQRGLDRRTQTDLAVLADGILDSVRIDAAARRWIERRSQSRPHRRRPATARTDSVSGLSIVAAIATATAHDAELRAQPAPDGGIDVQTSFRSG